MLAMSSTSPQSRRTSRRSLFVSGGHRRTCRLHALRERAWRPTSIGRWTPAASPPLPAKWATENGIKSWACQRAFRGLRPPKPGTFSTLSGPKRKHRPPTKVRFSNRPFEVKHFLTEFPPLRRRCHSRARASLRNRHQGPSSMGFEDEAEQSYRRPYRQTDGRSKRTHDLTSSVVPRGTSFHRSVELGFPPIAF